MRRITLLLTLLSAFFALSVQAATLHNIRYNRMEHKVQLVLDLDEAVAFQQFSLSSPPRIVLDFAHVKRSGNAGLVINSGSVAGIRSGYRDQDTLRVVIDLVTSAKANIYTLKPGDKYGNRIVVDIYDFDRDPALTLTSVEEAMPYVMFAGGALEDLPSEQLPPTVTPPITTTPVIAAQASTTSVIATPLPTPANPDIAVEREISSSGEVRGRTAVNTAAMKRDIVICIDPGHGGKDPGAVNKTLGIREKDVVLAIGKRLQRQLSALPGYRVFMTRSGDTYIPLRDRTGSCRRAGGDLFVSIHADAVENSTPSGSSVYILSTRGASSQLARYLANTENAVDLKWGVDVAKYDDDIQQALLNIQQEATLESSNVLAGKTLAQLGNIGKLHKNSVERANFAVLRSPEIPSMLVETAFISNLADAKRLNSGADQEKIARAIAAGIQAYFREHLPQHMLLAQ